jgi:putative NADH-flavin reductase
MPTHALLGATGATGSAVLRCYLASPPKDLTLNIFIRSRSKLLKAFPALESTTSITITITEAPLTDTQALQTCLRGAEIIHMCIATNDAKPGNRVSQDGAQAIASALSQLRIQQPSNYTKPTILIIRAAPLNPDLERHMPALVKRWLWFVLYHIYSDLEKASKVYEDAAPGLLDYVFVDPPALFDAEGPERTGHRLILEGDSGEASAGVNYADLGAAFMEIVERREECAGKSVGVSATGAVREEWGTLLWYQFEGLKGRIWG